MVKRILDLSYSNLNDMTKEEKLISIRLAEGRTLISEIICIVPPLLGDISNGELAASFGADMILLNMYDVDNPKISAIGKGEHVIKRLKEMTGKMIGVNLEPVDESMELKGEKLNIPNGRMATVENIKRLRNQGADMVVLTGNPSTGVSNDAILNTIGRIKKAGIHDLIITSGKMHSSGSIHESGENIINEETIEKFLEAGVDILLLPAPGTVPGIDVQKIQKFVSMAHKKGKLTMTAIGTSQEGSSKEVIEKIALWSKMTGTDIHHIGDCGMSPGIATPENIMYYSIAIRGKRHTYRAMARSVNR
ncbi:DUF7916 family protein [Anaeromicrobium sediminis]|uniref:PEP phosphonomutase n=1 Tax=Anaeromicrobium sediminis TaxID=1478221 RepID=A0A267MBR2_9FIRM|nr:PEP phosphonomutase [Anaeromicrobium sediminis]PAB56897.1 PEP phosphonomutase [Anaeromicrobium sediminis]